ncbi:MAG: sensor histidine kinase [Rivularia sp. (in: cyanobacteria)]
MRFVQSLPKNFRYLEWIYIAAHFGMYFKMPGYNLGSLIAVYSIYFLLGWIFPSNRPYWLRCSYILIGLTVVVSFRSMGIDIGLFVFFYLAKSYFLLGHRTTLIITAFTAIPWTISEYLGELKSLKSSHPIPTNSLLNPQHSLKFIFFTLVIYTAASTFNLMFTSMIVSEEKTRQRAEELSQQVETLAATLERTRIAREIHDSLGHTLTDLDIQLEVAQKLRSRNLEQSFQAVDTAKILARQCIEDVSQTLHQMRQSDFDLKSALTSLMEQLRQNSQLKVQFEFNLPQLNLYKSYQIYCIVKEAMMNVQKHARASQVSFSGNSNSEAIVLDIKDNGFGFDSEKKPTGFGLQGMMERVQLLGGKIEINTALTQGTQIKITLPL